MRIRVALSKILLDDASPEGRAVKRFVHAQRKILAGGYADLGATFAGINACFFDVFRTDWTIWPLYLGVAFAVIPPHVRPATTALVNACWGIYISYMTAHAG
mgnify:CR=1 FL=1